MKTAHIISGIFLVLFLLGGGIAAMADAAKTREKVGAASVKTALNGSWAAAYEKEFNKKIHIYNPSVTAWGILNYALFDEGRDGVLVGGDGWLFTREEFDYAPRQDEIIRKNLDFIKTAKKQLDGKNIGLLVVMVPAKARIYGEHLGRYHFPSYRAGIYAQAVQELRRDGIPVADPLPAMERAAGEKSLFLKTDTHWTPDGAKVAANAVAETVRREMPGIELEPAGVRTVQEGSAVYEGDLLRYVPLGPLANDLGPPADTLLKVRTLKTETTAEDTAGALFGDETLPVTLVGTSYSANPNWNFAGYLEETLKTSVLNAAKEGQGPFETMRKYLSDGSLSENPPRLVVWEIPERYLPVAYNATL